MERPVLIVSTEIDLATDAVVLELRRREVPFVRLNTDRYPYELGAALEVSNGGVRIAVRGAPLDPRSIWYRRIRSAEQPPGVDPGVHDYCLREAHALIHGLALTGADRVMSDPAAIARAENKVLQLSRARQCGLEIPETCVTNDPARAAAFLKRHPQAIAKPVRSGWFQDAFGEWSIYTTLVTDEMRADLTALALTPCIFQPLVRKACDVRVTIVGQRVVATEIDSQSDESSQVDWRRTTNPDLVHRRVDLGPQLSRALLALMADLRLEFGAIDLVRTPDDRYVFLEVNPNGQWLWLDERVDAGITPAVVDWLTADA